MELSEYVKMDAVEVDHFWFRAKRLFLGATLDRFFTLPSDRIPRALDFGCGTGAVLEFLAMRGYEAHGVDMSPEALAFCRAKGLRVSPQDIHGAIPYPDDSFDLVCALDVLEHIEGDRAAVREILRVLRPGGTLVAMVPAHQWLFSYHDAALHHFRRYGRTELAQLISSPCDLRAVRWMHASILIPAIVIRLARTFVPGAGVGSDVRPAHPFTNAVMGAVYHIELFVFRYLRLPFGLSLIAVGTKRPLS